MAVTILGVETSCDETAVAVVRDGRILKSNVIASQVDIHSQYGGVVPEVASRQHMIHIAPVVEMALDEAEVSMADLDAVAVTYGPGLAGSLLVGLNVAKSFSYSLGIPMLGVNHLEGHIYSAWLMEDIPDPAKEPGFPLLCLIASGGHTDLALMEDHGRYRLLGRTRDDAAGRSVRQGGANIGLGLSRRPLYSKGGNGREPFPDLPQGLAQREPRLQLQRSKDSSCSTERRNGGCILHQRRAARTLARWLIWGRRSRTRWWT